ncbi:MAG TPA: LuxR C-terminal-related transcriptional regulator [Euzebyales bacterium]|nr:LuxR C-terminal-related transcriptional regulator [Euzebyales bacterium]
MDDITVSGTMPAHRQGRVLVLGRWRSLVVRSFVLLLTELGVAASTVDERGADRASDDVVALLVCDDVGAVQAAPVLATVGEGRDIVVVALDDVMPGRADVRVPLSAELDDLLGALRVARAAGAGEPAAARRDPPEPADVVRLTTREAQVATLLTQGTSSARIAAELGISVNTVRTHVQNIMSKLGVSSRLEVAGVVAHAGAGGAGARQMVR